MNDKVESMDVGVFLRHYTRFLFRSYPAAVRTPGIRERQNRRIVPGLAIATISGQSFSGLIGVDWHLFYRAHKSAGCRRHVVSLLGLGWKPIFAVDRWQNRRRFVTFVFRSRTPSDPQ
jgi:hypothetical protein